MTLNRKSTYDFQLTIATTGSFLNLHKGAWHCPVAIIVKLDGIKASNSITWNQKRVLHRWLRRLPYYRQCQRRCYLPKHRKICMFWIFIWSCFYCVFACYVQRLWIATGGAQNLFCRGWRRNETGFRYHVESQITGIGRNYIFRHEVFQHWYCC